MKDALDTNKVRQLLNRSLGEMDEATLARLERARRTALEHQRASQPMPVLAAIGSWFPHSPAARHPLLFWGGILVLLAAMYGASSWMSHNLEANSSDIDIAILTDELPIEVYVD